MRITVTQILISVSLFLSGYSLEAKVLPSINIRMGCGGVKTAEVDSSTSLIFSELPGAGDYDRHVEDYIIFGVDYHTCPLIGSYDVSVELEVTMCDENGDPVSVPNQTLQIFYDGSSTNARDREIVVLKGGYCIDVTIVSITINGSPATELPGNMYIETQITIERFVDYTPYVLTTIPLDSLEITLLNSDCGVAAGDEIRFSWSHFEAAEDYDVEWVFVNDYGLNGGYLNPSELEVDFIYNSTRVTTSATFCDITNTFDHGYLVFRVRPVGRYITAPSVPVFGRWSYYLNSNSDVGYFLSNNHPVIHITSPHEPQFNWQVTATFAEEGKRRDVIGYSDGTLRTRQTVTRLSTEGVAVVGETVYDYNGRPAIQILPAPVPTLQCGPDFPASTIHFYRDFNKANTTGEAYTASDFDKDPLADHCGAMADSMSTASGASLYYSPDNPYQLRENSFIPDAVKFPFSQVEYTPDNTGRIRRQGGVGPTFQLNSDHETEYLYGTPHQVQLDRLFGSEAGNAAHFKKNAVIDPNGQTSVSYIDMADRVVATALVGPEPENMVPLDNQPDSLTHLLSDLFNEDADGRSITNTANPADGSIRFTGQVLVPVESDYAFYYDLSVVPNIDTCRTELCMHCVYDLEMTITDECGELFWPTESDSIAPVVGHFTYEGDSLVFTTSCEEESPYTYGDTIQFANMQPGVYTINKVLHVNEEARDYYISEYMTSDTTSCILNLSDFVALHLAATDTTDCAVEFDCEDCLRELGDRDYYIATGPHSHAENALSFDWQYEECVRHCTPVSLCLAGYDMMLADVSKGGQYAQYEDQSGNISLSLFPLSVLNPANLLPANSITDSTAWWKNPYALLNGFEYPMYFSASGTRSLVLVQDTTGNGDYMPAIDDSTAIIVDSDGFMYVYPENLSHVEDFLEAWQYTWAYSLVTYHPEWCYYESCREYARLQHPDDYLTSDKFDDLLDQISTFSDAVDAGLIVVGGGSNPYDLGDWFTPDGSLPFELGEDAPYDPFVVRGDDAGEIFSGESPFYGARVETEFLDYQETGYSIEALAALAIACRYSVGSAACQSATPEDYFGSLIGSTSEEQEAYQDTMWIAARNMYLSVKRRIQYERDIHYTIFECPGYNRCIGEHFNTYENDFFSSTTLDIYDQQPCRSETAWKYYTKTPRFPKVSEPPLYSPNIWEFNDQCPNELNLQNLLNELAISDTLDATGYELAGVDTYNGVFAYDYLYNEFTGPDYIDFPDSLIWNATASNDTLSIELMADTLFCEIELIGLDTAFTWDDISYIYNLKNDSTTGGFTFDVYYSSGDSVLYSSASGYISCLDLLASCDSLKGGEDTTFCQVGTLGTDLINLWNALNEGGDFYLEAPHYKELYPDYEEFITPSILEISGASSPEDVYWSNTGTLWVIGTLSGSSVSPGGYMLLTYSGDIEDLFAQMESIVGIECGEDGNSTIMIRDTLDSLHLITHNMVSGADVISPCTCWSYEPPVCCTGPGYEEYELMQAYIRRVFESIEEDDPGEGGDEDQMPEVTRIYTFPTDPSMINSIPPILGSYIPSLDQDTDTDIFTHDSCDSLLCETLEYDLDGCVLHLNVSADIDSTEYSGDYFIDEIELIPGTFDLTGEPDVSGFQYGFTMLGILNEDTVTVYGSWCVPMRKCDVFPPCGTIVPVPPVTFVPKDPCVEMLINTAYQNATDDYEEWYEDFTSGLAQAYTEHCLNSVDENLRMEFDDLEYHYTLYYYDQAGNLVRTVPPAGVKPLPITSPYDSLAMRINEDRTYGSRRVYTFHNLASTYSYNSLNQLTRQAIPDHDKMDIWETSLSSGLHPSYRGEEIQLISSAYAYTGGTVPTTSANRGYLYNSIDGGQHWTRMNGLVAADMKKVKMISSTTGYAIGKEGVLLRTADGGKSWDMLNTYVVFNTIIPVHFNDIAFNSPTGTPTYAIIVGEKGIMIRMSNLGSGETFTRITPSVSSPHAFMPSYGTGWNNIAAEFVGTEFFMWTNFAGGPHGEGYCVPFWSSTIGSGSPSITTQTRIWASELTAIHQFNSTSIYTGGTGGRLYYSQNNYRPFQMPVNHTQTFRKLWFYNTKVGLAIIEDTTAQTIYSTLDSGRTWVPLSAPGDIFRDWYVVDKDPTCSSSVIFNGARLIAVGDSGLVARITLIDETDGAHFGIDVINSPGTGPNLTACWGDVVKECTVGGDYTARIIVGGEGGAMYTAFSDGYSPEVEWQDITSDSLSVGIRDIEIDISGDSLYPRLRGIILDTLGNLYTFLHEGGVPDCSVPSSGDEPCNTNTVFCPFHCPEEYIVQHVDTTATSGEFFTLLARPETSSNDHFVVAISQQGAVNNVVHDAVRFNLTTATGYFGVTDMTVGGFPSSLDEGNMFNAATCISFDSNNLRVVMVGQAGLHYALTVHKTTTTATWVEAGTQRFHPLPVITDAAFNGSPNSAPFAAGRSGMVLCRRSFNTTLGNCGGSGNVWYLLDSDVKEDITSIGLPVFNSGVLGTIEGRLYKFTHTATPFTVYLNCNLPITEITTTSEGQPTTNRINDIACNSSRIYICGDNGTVMYSPSFTSLSFTSQLQGDVDYNGISFVPGTTHAIVVGENGRFERVFNDNRSVIQDVFTPSIHDVHFRNASEGYVAADYYTLRHTADGGQTWKVVLPAETLGTTLPIVRKFYTRGSGSAVAVGDKGTTAYIAAVSGETATRDAFTGSGGGSVYQLRDVQYDSYGNGWIVGGNGTNPIMVKKAFGAGSWTETAAHADSIPETGVYFTGMHIFPSNNTIAACGTKGTVDLWNGTAWMDAADYSPNNGALDEDAQNGSPEPDIEELDFFDIFFHDDINGYVAGDSGVVLKTIPGDLPDYNVSGLLEPFASLTWNQMGTDDNMAGQPTSTRMRIHSIAFPTRWEGIWTGMYDTTGTYAPLGLTRLVRDQAGIYSTHFFYDRLGRIAASQNTKQYNAAPKRLSYTRYDALGRITEAGEKSEDDTSPAIVFREVFGQEIEGYYNPKVINDTLLTQWIEDSGGPRKEVTKTFYDDTLALESFPADFDQNHLRKRVASVTYEDVYDGDDTTFVHATHYSYDIHGNVTTLLQDFPELGTIQEDQRYKRMDYRYDLISGNVHQVSYQAGKPDQWYHRYEYDADNRITSAYTSRYGWEGDTLGTNLFMDQDVPFWENDATYRYYLHGPLSRVETGDIAVQGTDYAYTLQGWIKGVNSNTLSPHRDLGQDGNTSSVNELFGRDVSGYTLGYYSGDYRPVNTADHWTTLTDRFEADKSGSDLLSSRNDLFNGNIGSMVTSFYAPAGSTAGGANGAILPQGVGYQYDQLNRLVEARAWANLDSSGNEWQNGSAYDDRYFNKFAYDANGNILSQIRSDEAGTAFDSLTYRYALDSDGRPIQNRLYHVNDAVSASTPTDDIEDQGIFDSDLEEINLNNNYGYDELGQLKRDNAESIDSIDWRVDGKIRQVLRPDTSSRKELEFVYDAMGNRIAKKVKASDGTWEKTTYYLRDAQGNVMCVYEHTEPDETASLMLQEEHIYGSSRIGMRADTLEMIGADPVRDTLDFHLERGMKRYELSNHLGNVLTVISDQKLAMDSSSVFDYYLPEVLAYNDYYPFGAPMNERTWSSDDYRYGFQGQEKVDEVSGIGNHNTAEFWEYDSRMGRRWNVDPVEKSAQSPYSTFSLNPILLIDPSGADTTVYIFHARNPNTGKYPDDDPIDAGKMEAIRDEMQKIFDSNDINVNVKIISPGEVKNTKLEKSDAIVAIRSWDWDFTEDEGSSSVYSNGDVDKDPRSTYIKTRASLNDANVIRKKGGALNFEQIIAHKASHEVMHQYIERARFYIYGSSFRAPNNGHNNYTLNLMSDGSMWRKELYSNPSKGNISQSQQITPFFKDLAQVYIASFRKGGCICHISNFMRRIGQ